MRASRRHSSRTESEDPPDQPSTSSGSRTNSPKKARVSAEDETAKVELIARLLSQIRAIRDRREAQLWKQLRRENSDWSEEVLKERISERLSDINTHVQDLEMRTTGVLLEELIKVQVPKLAVVHMQPSVSLSTSFRSPEAASSSTSPKKTFEPIEIKTEETMSTASGPASVAHSTSSLSVNTAETTVEKAAKQEASVMARIAELRRTGMWTKSRLPLCVEPQRNKTHWDYLLEEVKWMANDFRQERIFKRNMAKKVATAIVKQKREQELGVERAEQKVIRDGKRICASIAKMVRDFWQNVDKVVDFKAQEIIESKKRKALDQHLAFIVGEADKLSNMVQEGLTQDKTSKTPSIASMDDLDNYDLDEEESSDDETTLDQEEKHLKNDDVTGEVNALAEEADQGMDDLFASLPPEYVAMLKKEAEAKAGTSSSNKAGTSGGSRKMSPARPPRPLSASLVDYGSSDSSDNEETEMKMEEGKKGQSSESGTKDVKKEETDGESSAKRRRLEEQENEGKEGRDGEEGDQKTDDQEGNGDGRGVLEKVDYCKLNSDNSDERQQELANIAEEALKLQPKGFTLETTQVKTAVPFLMRGTLREYQMVGLDWLVTLYEKNLNGILADEMGLGKTIQTIALLAHLACSESIWGPHLIVVPTSVILNWEMELKRWCPAFKILTYFGSVKDRQEKRKGWSKPNAFHVCITSYKTITTDIRAFKMKAWQYLILDEAQNIKNWKSQRWQALLNVRARRRLLLTGTPLQNSLMELWSLMHFLMPAIFASHDDFKDWFSNPLTGMMDGSVEYNAPLVQRLHKVLRPFILRRLKSEVEKQLPAKTESVIKCPLSKRQRYLYDDFMSKRTTRDNLKSGNMMSVLNIVMQLRKCCNHPNLFEPRPVVSPFSVPVIERKLPAMVFDLCGDNSRLDDKRDIPQCLDIRDRMCGWTSTVTSKRPTIEELEQCQESIAPPVVQGFKFQRPAANLKQPPCSLGGPVVGPSSAVSRTSSAGPLQSGFGQMVGEERNGIIKTEEDVRSVAENGEYGHGEAMAVDEVKQENDVQVNGGSGSCEESSSARLPAVEADTPEPSAARLPGSDSAATPVTTAAVPVRQVYGKKQGQRVTPLVHPYLRTSTVMSTMTPLSISTSDRGFNHDMAEGGARQPIANYNYQFSPPLKRKKVVDSPLVSGQFQDCVPSEYQDRLRCIRRQRLERCQARFGQAPPPIFARELLSVLWHETRTTEEREDTDTWQRDGSNCEWDKIQSILMDHTERMMKRFVLYVDPVQVDSPRLFETSSGRPSFARLNEANCTEASRIFFNRTPSLTDRKLLSSRLQFPELRLIEYDCGKLQILANLLRELYMYKHRCLIFTQMSRMLDVLQAFLSFHGYQYFRLDGTTGVEQRQAMMERFNADPKIFCFILSTRSGGVGVNLTGADTVIFYDSDWNPTMDAQAQDRCHRIGQTRNVSIYRLISERTIEENILKKAMQKRRLGELAIDEAGFTPQFFKQNDNIRDLFEGEEVASEVAATVDAPKNQKDLETAMASLEDEQDVAAARQAAAEARADRAEFDESRAPTASQANGASEESKDDKYIELIEQLRPIERYAVNFLEAEYKPDFEDEVKETEAMIEQKKEDWVRAHEKAMKTADDDPLDDDFYGCGSLLDEVRSSRGRPAAARRVSRAPTAPTRHSARRSMAQPRLRNSPLKTVSGRRSIVPSSTSHPSSSSQSSTRSPTKSAAHVAARSAVRKAVARTSTSSTDSGATPKRGRGRPRKEVQPPATPVAAATPPVKKESKEPVRPPMAKPFLPPPLSRGAARPPMGASHPGSAHPTPSPPVRPVARVVLAPPAFRSPQQSPTTVVSPAARRVLVPPKLPVRATSTPQSPRSQAMFPVRVVHQSPQRPATSVLPARVHPTNSSPVNSTAVTTPSPQPPHRVVYRRVVQSSGSPAPRRVSLVTPSGQRIQPPPLPVRVLSPAARVLPSVAGSIQRPSLGEYERPRFSYRRERSADGSEQ